MTDSTSDSDFESSRVPRRSELEFSPVGPSNWRHVCNHHALIFWVVTIATAKIQLKTSVQIRSLYEDKQLLHNKVVHRAHATAATHPGAADRSPVDLLDALRRISVTIRRDTWVVNWSRSENFSVMLLGGAFPNTWSRRRGLNV